MSWSPDRAIAAGLTGIAQGTLVEIDGSGPALVTALHRDYVEIAPLANRVAAPGASVIERGPLAIPVSLDMVGRIVDCLGTPLDGGPAIGRDGAEPIFGRAPAVIGGVSSERITTGFLALDLKVRLPAGCSVLAIGQHVHALHWLRHQHAAGRTCIVATPALDSQRVAAARRGGVPCIHVAAGPSAAPAAQWLVPWAAMAIAAHLRDRGQHVVVLIESVDSWCPHAQRFPDHGTWSTQLARLSSRAFGTDASSVTLIARVDEARREHAAAFDRHIDLWRAARGDIEPGGVRSSWKFVRPPIRVASMHIPGGACHANGELQEVERAAPWLLSAATTDSALRKSIELGRKVRACMQWHPGATVDSLEQIACLFGVRQLTTLSEAAVQPFLGLYLAALRDRHAGMLERVRHDGRLSAADEQLLRSLAETVATSMPAANGG